MIADESRTYALDIWAKIEAYQTIVLHRHIIPDYDALGSVFGLRDIIKTRWPEKNVYVVGSGAEDYPLVPAADLIPDETWDGALAIICDCSTNARVDDQRFTRAEFVIKIDHHQDFSPFGDISWVDTQKVAAAQLIVELFRYGEEAYQLRLTPEACLYLYCAFYTDSGGFRFVSGEQATLFFEEMNMLLIGGNISPQNIIQQIEVVDVPVMRISGYIKQSFKRPIPELAYATVDAAMLEANEVSWPKVHGLSNSLMGIRGVQVWALFIEAEGRIICELRSIGPAINELAHQHGGGGHRLACGCSAKDWQEVDCLIKELAALIQEWQAGEA